MKKKWVLITAIVLLFTFPLTACGSSGKNDDANVVGVTETTMIGTIGDSEEVIETIDAPKAGGDSVSLSSGKVDNLVDLTDAWTELYSVHESAINAYTGMPIISLVMVALPLANSIFYSMLDLENLDGKFSGKIGFGVTEGYYNKSGDIIEFGQDWIRDVDGTMQNDKAGDRVLTDGLFDAGKGYFRMDDSAMRSEKTFSRTYTEFIRDDDGAFLCLYQVSSDLDYGGNENKTNTLVFIDMTDATYDFVTASGTLGVDGKLLALTQGMTVKEATAQFIEAGYTIDETGGIQNGVFVVN